MNSVGDLDIQSFQPHTCDIQHQLLQPVRAGGNMKPKTTSAAAAEAEIPVCVTSIAQLHRKVNNI